MKIEITYKKKDFAPSGKVRTVGLDFASSPGTGFKNKEHNLYICCGGLSDFLGGGQEDAFLAATSIHVSLSTAPLNEDSVPVLYTGNETYGSTHYAKLYTILPDPYGYSVKRVSSGEVKSIPSSLIYNKDFDALPGEMLFVNVYFYEEE